jgi:RNase P subunit RPR2
LAIYVDILQLFPDLAAIGPKELQVYCDQWLKRPIARECGLAQIIIDDQRNMQVTLDKAAAEIHGDLARLPLDELLGYIVDRNFADANERWRLHASIREARQRLDEIGKRYEVTIGKTGTLYLVCKNPNCAAQMMSDKKATEGQRINSPTFDIMCLKCGQTHAYEGSDFKLAFEQ